jgi:hypothetical protein
VKVVRSSASCTGRLYPEEMFLVLIFTRGLFDPRFGKNMSLKNPVIPLGIDPVTARQIVQRLNNYATPGPINRIYENQKLLSL